MDAQPLTLVAIFRVRPGQEAALDAALHALVGPTLAEPGCLSYDLHRSIEDPAVWFFTETWTTREAHQAHDLTAHVASFRAAAPELLAEPMLLLKGVRA
jgi:quinol monooxygenase YgiN